ncbi:MAG: hypothetical protein U0169_24980 [Polyangiaceae bacterium]
MSVNKLIGFATAAALVSVLSYGCSSKSGDGDGSDAGAVDDSSAPVTDSGRKDGGVTSDASKDAATSSCLPAPVASVPAYVASPRYAGKCTDQELADFRTKCYGTGAAADCNAWAKDHVGCYTCEGDINTQSNNDAGPLTWGMVVGFPVGQDYSFQLNLGGWLQSLDPSTTTQACAVKVQALLQCRIASCATNCPLPGQDASDDEYQAALDEFRGCLTDSNDGPCKTYFQATSCVSDVTMNNAALQPVTDYLTTKVEAESVTAYFKVLKTMCGFAPTTDGGTDGSATDSGTDSGSDGATTTDSGSDGSSDAAGDADGS